VRRELVSKRGDSGFRRGALRFDPLEVRFCLRELGDDRISRRGSRAISQLFFARHFHSKVLPIQFRIAFHDGQRSNASFEGLIRCSRGR
jgi:hypothetical protein